MLRNNVIVEDEKEINYSSSNHSTPRSIDHSKLIARNSEKNLAENSQYWNKDKSFSKDLVEQMKEKIRRKQINSKS